MLTVSCTNPEIMGVLTSLGHGDKILIADGNYPLATESGTCPKVYLSLTKGKPTVTEVLEVLMGVEVFERAEVMTPGEGEPEPQIFQEFRGMLSMDVEKIGRFDFYKAASDGSVKLAINTGESRTYANLMLTIGVA